MSLKVLTIAQQKGGAGKTTIAAHLAVAFSQRGKRVTAIDIDPQGSFTKWYKLREEKFGSDFTGMSFSNISGWRLHNEIAASKHDSDVIIIDSPPQTQTETKTAIRAADLVIIPAQPSPTDLWATDETLDIVGSERVPHRILLNRVIFNANLTKEISAQFTKIMDTRIGNRISFASAMMDGRTVTEFLPSSIAALEVKDLLREIEGLLFPVKIKKDDEQTEEAAA